MGTIRNSKGKKMGIQETKKQSQKREDAVLSLVMETGTALQGYMQPPKASPQLCMNLDSGKFESLATSGVKHGWILSENGKKWSWGKVQWVVCLYEDNLQHPWTGWPRQLRVPMQRQGIPGKLPSELQP